METADLTVVIPTRDGAEILPTALAHLEVQSLPAAQFEIVVVDYSSDQGSSDVPERYSAGAPVRTRYVQSPDGDCARARNLGARFASGRWLLFLDAELLAGPGLVEAHLRALEAHHGQAVIIGRVQAHPQVDKQMFTRRFRSAAECEDGPAEEIDVQAWTFANLSVSVEAFEAAGGFDEDLGFDGLQELALAWRLRQGGVKAVHARDAVAYAWRPARLMDERRRQYMNGYSLHILLERIDGDELKKSFPSSSTPGGHCLERLVMPLYRRLCARQSGHPGCLGYMCERVLNDEFCRGYRDAARGRPARFGGQIVAEAPETARV